MESGKRELPTEREVKENGGRKSEEEREKVEIRKVKKKRPMKKENRFNKRRI